MILFLNSVGVENNNVEKEHNNKVENNVSPAPKNVLQRNLQNSIQNEIRTINSNLLSNIQKFSPAPATYTLFSAPSTMPRTNWWHSLLTK